MDQQNLQQDPSRGADAFSVPGATMLPIGETWAPGVHPMLVSPRSKRLRWGIAGVIVVAVVVVVVVAHGSGEHPTPAVHE